MRYQPTRYRQVREILDWIQVFHEALSIEYQNMANGPVRERVALLLQYLADHQRTVKATIKHFEEDADTQVLNTWHDHFPELDLPDNLHDLKSHLSTISTNDVVRLALQFHDLLIHLYEEIRNSAPTDEVKDVFDNLALMESREKERMLRDANMLEDI